MALSGMLRWGEIIQRNEALREVAPLQYGELLKRLELSYGFNIEVRQYLHQWLEEQHWCSIDPDNPLDEPKAAHLLQTMTSKLQGKVLEMKNNQYMGVQHARLEYACANFQKQYRHMPLEFVRHMQCALNQEMAVLQEYMQQINPDNPAVAQDLGSSGVQPPCVMKREAFAPEQMKERMQEILNARRSLAEVKGKVKDNQELVNMWKTKAETEGEFADMEQFQNPLGRDPDEMLNKIKLLDAEINTQCHIRNELGELLRRTLYQADAVVGHIVDREIISWCRKQQLACNGAPPPEDAALDKLQFWYDSVAEVLILMKQILEAVTQQVVPYRGVGIEIPDMNQETLRYSLVPYKEHVARLLSKLFDKSLVVERQPDQVVQKKTYFNATVRLLVPRALGMTEASVLPVIEASVLTEDEVRQWCQNKDTFCSQNQSLKLTDNQVKLEFQRPVSSSSGGSSTGAPPPTSAACEGLLLQPLCASFRMQYEVHVTNRRRGQERVTELKRCFCFKTTVDVDGTKQVLQVLSLPVVLTVHCNQKCRAAATILWDNAFAVPYRESFEVPGSVAWSDLAPHISTYCKKMTGRALEDRHLQCLADKIFGHAFKQNGGEEVTLSQFREVQLKEHRCSLRETKMKTKRNCTFWDWFFDAVRVLQKNVRGMWEEGYIEGFVSKAQAEDMLLSHPQSGTFLFRFSDSECGALSIAMVDVSNGKSSVRHLEPQDPDSVNIADKIKGRNRLTTIYPKIPKDQALEKYYTVQPNPFANTKYRGLDYIYETENVPSVGSTLPPDLADMEVDPMEDMNIYLNVSPGIASPP